MAFIDISWPAGGRHAGTGHRRDREGRPALHRAFPRLTSDSPPAASAPFATTACWSRRTASRSCAARSPTATTSMRRWRRHACPPSRDLQGNARRRHGRDGEGAVLAARGVPQSSTAAQQFILIGGDAGGRAFLLRPRRRRSPRRRRTAPIPAATRCPRCSRR